MTDVHFTVVPYATCVEQVIAFRNANREIARDRQYFEWRYERRPCRWKPMIVWGIDERNRRVAAASLIPHDFYVLDGVYPVGLLGDISVAPECRGRGIGTRMLQFLRQDPALETLRACVVLPNDEAMPSLERAGWRQVTTIARWVKIVDVGPRLRSRFGERRAIADVSRAINRLARFMSRDGWQRQRALFQAGETSGFDPGFDELWNEIPKSGRILALRDRSYLHWRYHEHPTVRYRNTTIRYGQRLRGYVVFHVADNVAVVDDFLAADATVGESLIEELLSRVRHEGLAADIHVRCNAASSFAIPWTRYGFVRRRDFQRVMAGVPGAGRYPAFPPGEGLWFVTAGDKDV